MNIINLVLQFSVPQIEYPLVVSSKKGSHVYFLLIVVMVLLLWCQIVLLWHQVTMVESERHLYQTMVLPRKLAYCPLVGILFEVLRIDMLKTTIVYPMRFWNMSDKWKGNFQNKSFHQILNLKASLIDHLKETRDLQYSVVTIQILATTSIWSNHLPNDN